MESFANLHAQNHELTELSNVLLYLFQDRTMCDTGTACTLFFNFVDKLKVHLDNVDHLYGDLLTNNEASVNQTATKFMSGEQEIRRILDSYFKTWCNKKKHELLIGDHTAFLRDTQEIFDLILARIQDETEHLYPLVREVKKKAA